MKLTLFAIFVVWTALILTVEALVPTCDWCASNSLCLNNTCTCQGGGDPYFTCETSGYSYCSVKESAVHTFSQETADVWLLNSTLFAQLTTTRSGINRGVCEFNVTAKYDRVQSVFEATEAELSLKQKDFLGIFITIAVKIKSRVENGVYVSEISSRPSNSPNYTTPIILRSTDQPLGSGQYVSYSCQLAYGLTSDNFTVVTIPCCGLELGYRPHAVGKPRVLSGVYLRVDPARNPTFTTSTPQNLPLCLARTTYNLAYVESLTGLADPSQAMTYLGLTNHAPGQLGLDLLACPNKTLVAEFLNKLKNMYNYSSFVKCISQQEGIQDFQELLTLLLDYGCYGNVHSRNDARKLIQERCRYVIKRHKLKYDLDIL